MARKKILRTKACFRFVSRDIDPRSITKALGIRPTRSHQRGSPVHKHPGRKHPYGVWRLESRLDEGKPLSQHLIHLMKRLQPRTKIIRAMIKRGMRPDFFCGVFCRQNGFIELPSDLWAGLTKLGVPMQVHFYYE